ncbi:hypothetical protein G6011_09264 [Alternaria panax]|uniref:Uncharacterized protein n=1 Tax=Alternaria panax TaxID=48097 RepID=A0AAD4IAU1_9PLEO|nr:hypothetical protein G6011_09264 [Alternaria panax]
MDSGTLVSSMQFWNDPGASNKKLSLVDLTTTTMRARAGRSSGCDQHASLTRQLQPDSRCDHRQGQPDASFAPDQTGHQPPSGGGEKSEKLIPTASLTDVALSDSEALWGVGGGREDDHDESDTGHGCLDEATQHLAERQRGMPPSGREAARSQTTVINAAYLGPRVAGKTSVAYNKPIVVDIELPVWGSSDEPSVVYSRANVG